MSDIKQRYQMILEKIKQTELAYGRDPGSVNLIAVSKTKPVEMIREMASLGQRAFGENYLQEAIAKQQQLNDLNLQWHFIGHIQSNKTKDIAENFDWVHGVDRLKIARRLSDQRPSNLPKLNVCLQVNLQAEETKSGISPDQVLELAKSVAGLSNIKLCGLMAIPSPNNPFEKQRELFHQLRLLLDKLNEQGLDVATLSMGMTDDMEAAIAEGATHIRIGTALFGARHYA